MTNGAELVYHVPQHSQLVRFQPIPLRNQVVSNYNGNEQERHEQYGQCQGNNRNPADPRDRDDETHPYDVEKPLLEFLPVELVGPCSFLPVR